MRRNNESLDDLAHSPKLLALKELLNECGIGKTEDNTTGGAEELVNMNGHRVLIFCQLRSMIGMLIERC